MKEVPRSLMLCDTRKRSRWRVRQVPAGIRVGRRAWRGPGELMPIPQTPPPRNGRPQDWRVPEGLYWSLYSHASVMTPTS